MARCKLVHGFWWGVVTMVACTVCLCVCVHVLLRFAANALWCSGLWWLEGWCCDWFEPKLGPEACSQVDMAQAMFCYMVDMFNQAH